MKVYLTFGIEDAPEGFEKRNTLAELAPDSVEELKANCYLEKVPSLIHLMDDLYVVMKEDSMAEFHSHYFTSSYAWSSPYAVRGICEFTLNFASKDWRDQNKYGEVLGEPKCNFEIQSGLMLNAAFESRNDETKGFAQRHYCNACPAIIIKCTKKPL